MRSPLSSLLLATSLVALPVSAAQPPAEPAESPRATTANDSGPKKITTAKGKRTARPTTSKSAAASKPAASKKASTPKDAKKADCDTPVPKVTVTKPPPVQADPFAPIVAPCTDPKP